MTSVFVDVDTQLDFLVPAGALYAPGAERIEPVLQALTRFAVAHKTRILSTADAHAEDDEEFRTWKPHCVVGTQGQQKCSATLTGQASVFRGEAGELAPQIILEKQTIDPFKDPRLGALLERLQADRYIVYGLVTDYCVANMVFGLLEQGASVELVTDAIHPFDVQAGQETLKRFRSGGGILVTSSSVLGA